MELIRYQNNYTENRAIQDFLDMIYQREMTQLASDFLSKTIQVEDIKTAVKKAIYAIEKTGVDSKKHFKPLISVKQGTSFLDCRLSKLGYTMVLLNLEPKSKAVATFQFEMAQQILRTSS